MKYISKAINKLFLILFLLKVLSYFTPVSGTEAIRETVKHDEMLPTSKNFTFRFIEQEIDESILDPKILNPNSSKELQFNFKNQNTENENNHIIEQSYLTVQEPLNNINEQKDSSLKTEVIKNKKRYMFTLRVSSKVQKNLIKKPIKIKTKRKIKKKEIRINSVITRVSCLETEDNKNLKSELIKRLNERLCSKS